MNEKQTLTQLDEHLQALRAADWQERESISKDILLLAQGPHTAAVRSALEDGRQSLPLEARWDIDEVLEATEPKADEPEAPQEPEEEEDPNRPLTTADLELMYDDPRGLTLYRSKRPNDDRWFATQTDPRTGQPQTFQLHEQEIAQLKQQLAGSPYWLLGSGLS